MTPKIQEKDSIAVFTVETRDFIPRFLEENGFDHKRGSVCFGDDSIDAVSCVLVAQKLADEFDWFQPSVQDIRMLRIEDNNDLMPAISLRDKRAKKSK